MPTEFEALLSEPPNPVMSRQSARAVLDEFARLDPQFAAEQKKHDAEMRAWRRRRQRLARQVRHEEIPFVVAALGSDQMRGEAAAILLRVMDFLWEQDAPSDLMLSLLTKTLPLIKAE